MRFGLYKSMSLPQIIFYIESATVSYGSWFLKLNCECIFFSYKLFLWVRIVIWILEILFLNNFLEWSNRILGNKPLLPNVEDNKNPTHCVRKSQSLLIQVAKIKTPISWFLQKKKPPICDSSSNPRNLWWLRRSADKIVRSRHGRRRKWGQSIGSAPCQTRSSLTSFLSSQLKCAWQLLWQYVPVIGLYDQNQDTVFRFLLLHKLQRIDDFRLYFRNDDSHIRQIEAWIVAVIERNVRELDLSFSRVFMLPSRLFTCETLVDLRLHCCGGIPTNLYAVRLPRLKRLHLECCRFNEANESLTRLLSGSTVLEELQIRDAEYSDLVRCNISSPTIKKLKLNFKLPIGREEDDYNRD